MSRNRPRRTRLIATDLDNTLLRSDRSVSERTVAALTAARDAGIPVVPVTARNPVGVREVNAPLGFTDWALCGNGAYAVHLGSAEVLYSVEAPAQALHGFVHAVRRVVPGACFAVVREFGERFIAGDGYAALASPADHSRDPSTMERAGVEDLVSAPALKLIFRHATLPAADLYAQVAERVPTDGLELTMSGAPFVEVMAAGVSKADGLRRLCRHLGVARDEVLALGDGLNDVPMLRWAGHGVAVANAVPAALDAADEVTGAADGDGVAMVIERLTGRIRTVDADSPRSS